MHQNYNFNIKNPSAMGSNVFLESHSQYQVRYYQQRPKSHVDIDLPRLLEAASLEEFDGKECFKKLNTLGGKMRI